MAQIRAKLTKDAEQLKGWTFRLIRLMVERGDERALILELFRLIDWMIRLPEALEADCRQTGDAYEAQQRMPSVTTVEQAGIDQGVKQGEATILLRLLNTKFGAEAVEHDRTRIESAEPEQLEAWSERILSAETPEIIFH